MKKQLVYDHRQIENRWRAFWEKDKTFQIDLKKAKKPYYNLMMFPYPSAEGLHVGNMYAFTGSDIWGRYMRMKGYDVFEPIGLDGFGIHSENYALKVGRHPKEQAKISEKNFYRQLKLLANIFSWDNKLETYNPEYYRWTQWIFIQLFKRGLAYRKKSSVNWCPSCKTVLADEQVINGLCERCGAEVREKKLEQWFFKITDYADRLLANTKKIDWSKKVLIAQQQWIGRKQGIEITYPVVNTRTQLSIACFTTRPDTNFGASFIVLAPEHPLIEQITSKEYKKTISNYISQALKKSSFDRMADTESKTGVFTGAYALNRLTNKKLPVWVSDFVLMEYGSGAVVGVPGHDKRDFQFAKRFSLPVIRVVCGPGNDASLIKDEKQVWEGGGRIINSGFLNNLTVEAAKKKIAVYLEKKGWAKKSVTYHLRDWLISRQRYWGPPIPMIYCKKCGWQPVSEDQLPVLLPEVKDWRPKGAGASPLASIKDWVKTKCPHCAGPAKRETDVSDTFLDSAWYFLRYPSLQGLSLQGIIPWDKEITRKWLPVDMYIGGAEHSVLHLLYSRFLTMVFKDMGLLEFEEPFTKFRAHGLIIKDGAKMSKSKGNVVVPDEYIKKYGVDTFRCYLMFIGPLASGGDFRDNGIKGMHKFLTRVFKLCQNNLSVEIKNNEEVYFQHQTIKRVTQSIEKLKYNTALSALMEFVNFLEKQNPAAKKSIEILIRLLAPFAPCLTEEIWQKIKSKNSFQKQENFYSSIHSQQWPKYNEKYLCREKAEVVIQINGRARGRIIIASEQAAMREQVIKECEKIVKIQNYLANKKIKKIIFIKARLINFVVG